VASAPARWRPASHHRRYQRARRRALSPPLPGAGVGVRPHPDPWPRPAAPCLNQPVRAARQLPFTGLTTSCPICRPVGRAGPAVRAPVMKQVLFRIDSIEPFPDRSGNLTRRAACDWLWIEEDLRQSNPAPTGRGCRGLFRSLDPCPTTRAHSLSTHVTRRRRVRVGRPTRFPNSADLGPAPPGPGYAPMPAPGSQLASRPEFGHVVR
jgi:hypothetical protein